MQVGVEGGYWTLVINTSQVSNTRSKCCYQFILPLNWKHIAPKTSGDEDKTKTIYYLFEIFLFGWMVFKKNYNTHNASAANR